MAPPLGLTALIGLSPSQRNCIGHPCRSNSRRPIGVPRVPPCRAVPPPPPPPPPRDIDALIGDLRRGNEDLLEEMEVWDRDDAIVELPVMFSGEEGGDGGNSFDFARWELHRSSGRYIRLLVGTFFGVTTRRILSPVLLLVCWSLLVDLYNANEDLYGLPEVELPLTPFDLTAPVLGLLLVFRSNTAFERFDKGSDASWEITARFKSMIRQLLSWTAAKRFGSEEQAAADELADACLLLHGLIMLNYLRSGDQVSSKDQARLLRKALGTPAVEGGAQEEVRRLTGGASSLTPSAGMTAISLGITTRLPSLDFQETTEIDEQCSQILSALGTCEKLLRTPIPLGYTRYSVRFLWIWLTLLPFALVNTFAEFGSNTWWEDKPKPVLVFAMLFIAFIFLSIEDISVQIEEPFCILPLELHQKWLQRDARQMRSMSRAMKDINAHEDQGQA